MQFAANKSAYSNPLALKIQGSSVWEGIKQELAKPNDFILCFQSDCKYKARSVRISPLNHLPKARQLAKCILSAVPRFLKHFCFSSKVLRLEELKLSLQDDVCPPLFFAPHNFFCDIAILNSCVRAVI